jgi:hypothetical protein
MIKTLTTRLAPRQSIRNIFTASVIVIQAWAFFNLFREVPAIRLRLEFWDVLGTVAYIQAFALLESLFVTGLIVLVGMLLPSRLRQTKLSALGTTVIIVAACWSIFIHYDQVPFKEWPPEKVYGRLALLLAGLIITLIPVGYFDRVSALVDKLTNEGFILAQLYSLIGIVSIVIVIIRNVT